MPTQRTSISSVQFSRSVLSNSWRPHEMQHTRLPCPSPTPWACSKSFPLSQWCHPTVSSSVIPFSSRLQSFPASGTFQMSQFLASDGQSIGVSAWASLLPMNSQDWFPLGWTGWISLQSKGLSRLFSNTTVQKHQFLQLSFLYGPTIHDYRALKEGDFQLSWSWESWVWAQDRIGLLVLLEIFLLKHDVLKKLRINPFRLAIPEDIFQISGLFFFTSLPTRLSVL